MVSFKIEITCDRDEVEDLILQDPMGLLNFEFPVQIGDLEFRATCASYVCDASSNVAKLVLYSSEENE